MYESLKINSQLKKFFNGRFRLEAQPLRIPSFIDNWYPFHIFFLELVSLLTALNALSKLQLVIVDTTAAPALYIVGQ